MGVEGRNTNFSWVNGLIIKRPDLSDNMIWMLYLRLVAIWEVGELNAG